jgi:hypothetical protein
MEGEELRKWGVDENEVLFFRVALEPYLKHSGSITVEILFLAKVPVDSARKTAANSDDENAL